MRPAERLKIGEVARRAGVAPSVVAFYVREGLVPAPVKTSRNMAYYEPRTVDRVRLVRELAEKAFLPLRVIKQALASGASPEEIRATFTTRTPAFAARAGAEVDETSLLASSGLDAGDLRKLENAGVLEPRVDGGARRFGADDVAVVEALGRMRRAGLTPARGFGVEQVRIYRKAAERLAKREIELAMQGAVGRMDPSDLLRAADLLLDSADAIFRAMHRKALRAATRELGRRMKRGR